MKIKKILVLALSSILLTSCSSTPTITKESSELWYLTDENGNTIYDEDGSIILPLNTYVSITTTNSDLKDEMVDDFTNLVRKYHFLFDSHHNFDGINNIKTINDNYGIGPVEVDQDIIDILKLSIEMSKLTNGYFNPTIGTLSDVWSSKYSLGDGQSDPSVEEIDNAKSCVLSNDQLDEYVVIDDENNTVYLKKYDGCSSSVKLSLGAISKGYALDKIADELMKYDSGFLLSAGGSSTVTYVADNQIGELTWKIGVVDPDNISNTYSIIEVENSAISTSGDYQQYFINNEGIRRHHILNPFTGYPENKYRSVTLVAENNGAILDALSTTLFSVDDISEYIKTISNKYNLDIKAYVLSDNNGTADVFYSTIDSLLIN